MATALDIIKSSLRKIHVLGAGAPLSNEEASDALSTLNAMLSTWSAEGSLIYTESKETFNTTGAASYTIGSGADFDTVRPLYFSAVYVTQGNIDYPLNQIDNQQYARIAQKDLGSIPEVYYYDAGFPTATLFLYPAPTSTSTVTLYSFKPLTSFTNLTTDFSMPEEYRAALEYNLAEWIAPEYEREASPSVKKIAKQTKDAVIGQNRRNENFISTIDVPADRSNKDSGNIYGGWYT
jgi:hypothetical protein